MNPQTIATIPQEVVAVRNLCELVSKQAAIDRVEIAVKSYVESGIRDDNQLRNADDLLHQIAVSADRVINETEPAIAAAHSIHKAMLAEVKEWAYLNSKTRKWEGRWGVLRETLAGLILKYKRDKEELARRQQQEIERAAEQERKRMAAEARKAMRDGDIATANAMKEQAASIVAPVIVSSSPVLDHSKTRSEWRITLTDPMAVVQGIIDGVIPISIIKEFNLTVAKQEAARRGSLNWPGISAKQEDALSISRR